MNPRYVFAFCGLTIILVNFVADEGGMLDALTSRAPPATAEYGENAPQTVGQVAAGPSSAPVVTSGSSFGIGDYEAEVDADGWGVAASTPEPREENFGSGGGKTATSFASGALSDEKLGVEKSTGLAPLGSNDT